MIRREVKANEAVSRSLHQVGTAPQFMTLLPDVGHNAVANFNGIDYLVCHAYDAGDHGRSKLRIEKLDWVIEWPVVRADR